MATGRPREFDVDQAVDRAMKLFWRKGYEGTSLTDLTETLGITRPSLYAAFGNKEGLFRKALDRYVEGPSGYIAEAFKAPTARAAAEQILRGAVKLNTNPRHPGCLMVHGALACGSEGEAVRRDLNARRMAGERAIARRFDQAKASGDLPADSDPKDLARYLRSVVYGIAVQAAGGATRKELSKVVDLALLAWPESGTRKCQRR
jgi:AcrR family transcriptional regulator